MHSLWINLTAAVASYFAVMLQPRLSAAIRTLVFWLCLLHVAFAVNLNANERVLDATALDAAKLRSSKEKASDVAAVHHETATRQMAHPFHVISRSVGRKSRAIEPLEHSNVELQHSETSAHAISAPPVVDVQLARSELSKTVRSRVLMTLKLRQLGQSTTSTSFLSLRQRGDVPLHQEVLQEKNLTTYYADVAVKGAPFRVLFDTGSCEVSFRKSSR